MLSSFRGWLPRSTTPPPSAPPPPPPAPPPAPPPPRKRPGSGRKVNPASKRQKEMAIKQSRKTSKMQEKSSKVECVWETSSSGGLRPSINKQTCCGGKCNEQFDSKLAESAGTTQTCDLIGGLRSYYAALHKKQKREFIAERVDVGSRPEGDTANLRGKHIFSFHIDDPTSLKRNLADLQAGNIARLPKPNRDRTMHVCVNFGFFTFGGHSDTLYQDIARKYHGFVTNPAHLSPAEPRVHVSRKARRTERLPPLGVLGFKKDYISNFLKQAARGGCILPNHKFTVLPFNSVQSAHSAYARFEERRLLVPATESADGPRPHRSLCRYGNRLCGQTEESKPVHPDIATLSFFRQSWYSDPTLNDIIIRKWMPFAKCQLCKAFKLAEQKEQDPVKRKQIQRAITTRTCAKSNSKGAVTTATASEQVWSLRCTVVSSSTGLTPRMTKYLTSTNVVMPPTGLNCKKSSSTDVSHMVEVVMFSRCLHT